MTISQEDDGNQEGNPEPIMEAENENDDIKAKEDLEDEENEKDFVEDLLTKLMTAMEEINNLKKENEELKKKALVGDQDKQGRKLTLSSFKYKKGMKSLPSLRRNFIKTKESIMKKSYP